ncbi:MAG: hypothetical protein DRI86_08675 [Bacteroidetes bacterium]|nr:MAG: hypothetical protein DRI86_08675 [Bacteroidota bacterium]
MKTVLALNSVVLGSISYREVLVYENGLCYLENVNVLINNKIVKKVRFEYGEKIYEESLGKEIVEEYIFDLISNAEEKPNVKKRKKRKATNKKSKNKAAMDLMSELGL